MNTEKEVRTYCAFFMKLSTTDFKAVVKSTPLISIDLIVRDSEGKVQKLK